jgi:O-succinylbenzoic acid--CoA ligase
VRRLVALDLRPSEAFVEALVHYHDKGDAVLPLDHRLSPAARRALLEAMRPALVLDEQGNEQRLRGAQATEEGDALVLATSGSTGTPKGVVLTHDALQASAQAVNSRLEVDPGRDRWLSCLPFAHIGGLSVVLRARAAKVPVEVHPRFDPAAVLEAARRGATLVSLVPTALRRLGGHAELFRRIVLGGSAPPELLPPNTHATYGMTETASGVVYDGVPLKGVEVRVDDAGEIHVRGPMLLRSYRDGRDPKDAEGWFATGDAGAIGPDSRLQVFGRMDDLVISGGENVWPAAVEHAIEGLAGVAEVAVGGLADPEWGERVVAYVVPGPDGPPRLEALRAAVRDRLGPWAAPKQLVLTDALPRTPLGKVRRSELALLAGEPPRPSRSQLRRR